jgi:ApeA N-terminal domain 1
MLIYGVHFEDAEDFRLTSLSIRYSHLDAWVTTSGFTVNFDPATYPVEIRYSKPESIESPISDGLRISIDFSASGPSLPAFTNVSIYTTKLAHDHIGAGSPIQRTPNEHQ